MGHCAVGAGVELAYAVYGVSVSNVLYSISAGWDGTHGLVGCRCVLVCVHIRPGAGSGAAPRNAVSQVCQYCCGSLCLH